MIVKRQHTLSRSSAEAEYYYVVIDITHGLWPWGFFVLCTGMVVSNATSYIILLRKTVVMGLNYFLFNYSALRL